MKLIEVAGTSAGSNLQTLVDEYAGLLWNENDAMDAYGNGDLWDRAKARMKEIVAAVLSAHGKDGVKEFKKRARAREREADKLFMKYAKGGGGDGDEYVNHPVVKWAYRWQQQ